MYSTKLIHITRRLRQIRNAWHSQFKFSFVFTLQWIRFSGGVAHYLTRRYVTVAKTALGDKSRYRSGKDQCSGISNN